MARSIVPRKKQSTAAALPDVFYVAPTTPLVPKNRPRVSFSYKTAPSQPSAHLVDLRTVTASRPHPNTNLVPSKEKAEKIPRANFTIPRTVSEHPERQGVWNQLALVAFARFIFALGKSLAIGIAKLLSLPVTGGIALVGKLDPDRQYSLETELAPKTSVNILPLVEEEKIFSDKKEAPVAPPTVKNQTPRAVRPFNVRRALISFAGTSLAIIIPLQGMNVYRNLVTVKDKAEVAKSASFAALNGNGSFDAAQAALGQARESVDELGKTANTILTNLPALGGKFRSGKAILGAGESLATAATLVSKSLDFLNDKSLEPTAKIAKAQELAERAAPELASADAALSGAESLPGVDLDSLRDKVSSLNGLVGNFIKISPALRQILGEKETRRYLVLFQNNAELRPTGGFVGSFALVDIDRGEIKKVEVPAGGPYDLQGSLKASVLAPEPMRLISAKWQFQDANWYPSFPESARKLAWFYNQSGGPSVDGVIAVNAPVLSDLLDAVGPISMPEYGTIATGSSVLKTAQQIVESKSARESGKPKQFIADLLPRVLAKTVSGDEVGMLKTFSILGKALANKDVQLYFTGESEERAVSELGWSGELQKLPENFDSAMVVRTNIAGGKTDTVMKTSLDIQSEISADGTVTDHVTIAIAHEGKKGEEFTGVRNVSYVRFYVPEGSKLLKAGGDIRPPQAGLFDVPTEGLAPDESLAEITGPTLHDPNSGTAVNNEFGRTVFGAWTQTDPGAVSKITFDYVLPFKVLMPAPSPENLATKIGLATVATPSVPFGLLIEKQSGAVNTEVHSSLKLPTGWYPSLSSPAGIAQADGWSFTSMLDSDRAIGEMLSR